jgi:SRSO17 transposase
MQDAPNKSIETMLLHSEGDDANKIRAMQHFISEGAWDDDAVLAQHAKEVNKDLGEADGVLIIDGSDFPKQGNDSVGVKRQYCGELGKVANCQAGVFLAYASRQGYTLLDRRLYVPKEWLKDEAHADRREACGVPENLSFKTKPELALERVKHLHEAGSLSYRWLTCDESFGRDSAFLDAVANYTSYLAEVPYDTRVWLSRPETDLPQWSGKGRKPSRQRLKAGSAKAQPVDKLAHALPETSWQRLSIKEGSKGPMLADFACLSVVSVRKGLPGPEQFLILKRDVFSADIKYYLSNASKDTPLKEFARVSAMRWPIESCFEEGKQELGMGDYQLRGWTGWHHHMTLVILAHFFLVSLKLRLKDKAPKLTLPQIVLLLKASLPQPDFSIEKSIDIVNYYQERHEAAYQSHRKKRLAQLKMLEH